MGEVGSNAEGKPLIERLIGELTDSLNVLKERQGTLISRLTRVTANAPQPGVEEGKSGIGPCMSHVAVEIVEIKAVVDGMITDICHQIDGLEI